MQQTLGLKRGWWTKDGHTGNWRRGSRIDLDRSAVRHRTPDLLDFVVRNGDITLRPVSPPMRCADVSLAAGKAVNHYVASHVHTFASSAFSVGLIRIGDSQRAVECTLRVSARNRVNAFRSLPIAFALLRPDRVSAQSDPIRLQHTSTPDECEFALRLVYDDLVRRFLGYRQHEQGESKTTNQGSHESQQQYIAFAACVGQPPSPTRMVERRPYRKLGRMLSCRPATSVCANAI